MIILIDADGVLENLTHAWVEYLNRRYGTSVCYEDITDWDMTKAFPTLSREQVYGAELDEELYSLLRPLNGAPEYVKKLIDDGNEVYVVTSTPYQVIKVKYEQVMAKYYPFLSWKNFIITSNKQLIRGDVLIDDGIHNLVGGEYAKILVSTPYNEAFDAEGSGMIRAHDWAEIYDAVKSLEHIR